MAGRNLLADDSSATQGKNLLAEEPKEPAKPKDGIDSRAYAFIYGLGTGVVGAPGSAEEMLYSKEDVEASKKLGVSPTVVFPTPEDVRSILGYVGVPKPSREFEGWQDLGELSPAIVSGGRLLYKGGEYLITKSGEIINRFRGKPLEEAVKGLGEKLQTTTEKVGKEVGQKSEEESKRLIAEQAKRGVAQRGTAASMEREANLAKEESKSTLSKIGQPTDEYKLGTELRDLAVEKQEALKEAARKLAQTNKNLYFNEAKAKEKQGNFWSTSETGKSFLAYMKDVMDPKNFGKYSKGEVEAVKDVYRQLAPKEVKGVGKVEAEIGKIENVIRDVKKIPSMPTMTGAEAQKQQYMSKLAKKLEDSVYGYVDEAGKEVEGFAPHGRTFRTIYREMMTPLNQYESPVGKILTQQIEGLKDVFKADASKIPAAVFQSPQQIEILEKMGIPRQTLSSYAARYTANELSKLNSAEQVKAWLSSAKAAYLRSFPELEKKAADYSKAFERNEALVAERTESAKKMRQFAMRSAEKNRQDVENIKKMSKETQEKIGNDLYRIYNAKDETQMANQARNYVLKLREQKLIDPAETEDLLNKIRRVETEVKGKEAAKTALKGLLPYAAYLGVGTSVLGYSINKLLGGF